MKANEIALLIEMSITIQTKIQNQPTSYILDALLRFTYVNFELIERTIKRGISIICNGHGEANSTFLKSYNANKSTSYIILLYATN